MKKELIRPISIGILILIVIAGVYYYQSTKGLEEKIRMFSVNNEAVQKRAVAYLVRKGASAIPYLVEALQSDDPTVRVNAAKALGRINHDDVIEPLIRVLNDPDANIQYEAMEALNNRGTMALPTLLKTAQNTDPIMRARAIELLGRLGDIAGVDIVTRALQDTAAEVRAQAVIALRWILKDTSIPHIVPLLNDADNNVRMMVVFALGDLRNTAAARRNLEKALSSDDDQLREKAAHFLGESNSADAEQALCKALHDRKLEVRWTAAEALGKIGGPEAEKALSGLLMKKNEVEFVKNAAKKAIETIQARKK